MDPAWGRLKQVALAVCNGNYPEHHARRIAARFAFEIDAAASMFGDFADVGCAASCHDAGAGIDMRPEAGKVDIWHWKMSRSEPLGYVNDQFSEPTNGRKSDTGDGFKNRHKAGADNRPGPAVEWDGTLQTVIRSDGVSTTVDPPSATSLALASWITPAAIKSGHVSRYSTSSRRN